MTTWVDAGSSGAYNFPAFRERLSGYQVRVPVLLHVSAIGLTGQEGEARDLKHLDVPAAIATVQANRDHIVGIKVRMARGTVGGNALEPLRRAIDVAAACELPVMVHIGDRPPNAEDVVPLLRQGDIITHCASGIAAGQTCCRPRCGRPTSAASPSTSATARAVSPSTCWKRNWRRECRRHSISTDLHGRCVHGPVFDMPTTMAKMLAVGMPLPQVVQAATVGPARLLGLQAGTLAVGSRADLAVFTVLQGRFELADVHGNRRTSRFGCTTRPPMWPAGRWHPSRLSHPRRGFR